MVFALLQLSARVASCTKNGAAQTLDRSAGGGGCLGTRFHCLQGVLLAPKQFRWRMENKGVFYTQAVSSAFFWGMYLAAQKTAIMFWKAMAGNINFHP